MRSFSKSLKLSVIVAAVAGASLMAGCSMMGMKSGGGHMMSSASLTGAQEVPAVSTAAAGSSTITVAADKSVSGMVTVTGIAATAAHIHEAPAGVNGPVIVPLTKTGESTFMVPANAKLTDAQYASFKAGNMYVNVHSAAHPGGEIRTQLSAK